MPALPLQALFHVHPPVVLTSLANTCSSPASTTPAASAAATAARPVLRMLDRKACMQVDARVHRFRKHQSQLLASRGTVSTSATSAHPRRCHRANAATRYATTNPCALCTPAPANQRNHMLRVICLPTCVSSTVFMHESTSGASMRPKPRAHPADSPPTSSAASTLRQVSQRATM